MNWDDGYIADDVLNGILSNRKTGVIIEVVLDCCHSGTGTNDLSMNRPLDMGPKSTITNRFTQPPVDIVSRHDGDISHQVLRSGFR